MTTTQNEAAILAVKNLSVEFSSPEGSIKAVNDITFSLAAGETLAIVGESGSGKSQSFLAMMGLLAKNGRATGEVYLEGRQILNLSNKALDEVRGDDIAMIFQDPMTSLNPSLSLQTQLCEVLIRHKKMHQTAARAEAIKMLKLVGIPEAEKRMHSYPHQLSGGMRQRVMIAMAMLCDPKVLIADEPTTALDVTIQAQILDLFAELKDKLNTALILITHDLGVVAGLADNMIVLYGGRIMEQGPVNTLFKNPKHPYTIGLLHSTPNIEDAEQTLNAIAGTPPNLQNLPKGCAFAPRCPFQVDECLSAPPALTKQAEQHLKACYRDDVNVQLAYLFSSPDKPVRGASITLGAS